MKTKTSAKIKKRRRVKSSDKKKLDMSGWATTDELEIIRRRERAVSEAMKITPLSATQDYFADFSVRSANGSHYTVEIRDLAEPMNTCTCPDYHTNQLGTCKHIEKVLLKLKAKGRQTFITAQQSGSPFIEIYLTPALPREIIARFPKKIISDSRAPMLVREFFSAQGTLSGAPLAAIPALRHALEKEPKLHSKIRLSRTLDVYLSELQRTAAAENLQQAFLNDVESGKQSFDVVKFPLYPYQQQGMLHLAFKERALLADEMGLGKTVQAVAACELLRRLKNIKRVLIVATASLKAEWEEQINKFAPLPLTIIQGSHSDRLRGYQQPTFFYITNYEQAMRDVDDINRIVQPDVIILDEAQRIKNWQTKTAKQIKKLNSHYLFVLTGTPLENRIDDIYSLAQFINPELLGPLFRFNREFYQLDERGKPTGYQNLDELHRRLRPILLRRLKGDVEGDLPDRVVNHYFVTMEPEQRDRYDDYKARVAKLMLIAKRRPLLKDEMEKLQKWLACMRMLCDTPFILDSDCRICPKLDELETILEELLTDPDTKIIIFSEWERMLQLVRELAQKMSFGAAWHTGSVPQQKRRAEIQRFKNDAHCRLFLSTDAGSVGLNLQAANVVINMDLPWNPAKLEQRIARAWRKHQTRSVRVINLVSEDSIEQRMLNLLKQKQLMAHSVLHGDDDLKSMALPSGRAAFMQQMQEILGESTTPSTTTTTAATTTATDAMPAEKLSDSLLARFTPRLDLLAACQSPVNHQPVLLAVVDHADVRATLQSVAAESSDKTALEILDRNTYETLLRLSELGLISINQPLNFLHRSPKVTESQVSQKQRWITAAKPHLQQAERRLRMVDVLLGNDFIEETFSPLREGLILLLNALSWIKGDGELKEKSAPLLQAFIQRHELPQEIAAISRLNGEAAELEKTQIQSWHSALNTLKQTIEEEIAGTMLG